MAKTAKRLPPIPKPRSGPAKGSAVVTDTGLSAVPDLSHIAESLRPLAVPIGELQFDPTNARTHPEPNLDAIRGSLNEYGQLKPIVVNRGTKHVEAGNGTLQAALSLNWAHLAVVWVDHDPGQAVGYSLADNQSGALAGWDQAKLDALLKDLPSPNDPRLDKMLADLKTAFGTPATPEAGADPGPQVDRAADLQKKWKTEAGQLWVIPSMTVRPRRVVTCPDCDCENEV